MENLDPAAFIVFCCLGIVFLIVGKIFTAGIKGEEESQHRRGGGA